jgi:hypothetical protein
MARSCPRTGSSPLVCSGGAHPAGLSGWRKRIGAIIAAGNSAALVAVLLSALRPSRPHHGQESLFDGVGIGSFAVTPQGPRRSGGLLASREHGSGEFEPTAPQGHISQPRSRSGWRTLPSQGAPPSNSHSCAVSASMNPSYIGGVSIEGTSGSLRLISSDSADSSSSSRVGSSR